MLSCFLPGLSRPKFPKTWDTGKNWLPFIYSLHKIEVSDNPRKYVEGKAVTICGHESGKSQRTQNYGIIDSFKFEEIFKITKFTVKPALPSPP